MDSSKSLMHTVGSRVWLRDLDEGWVKGEVLNIGDDNKLNVRLEDGSEKAFSESEIPLQNPGVRGVEDMITLTYLNEPGVLWNLKVRYEQDDIYTYTGSILIAVNPFMPMPHLYGKHMMEQYKDMDQGELSPHAYAIADASYRQMTGNQRSQAILVSGESGAGKTETSKHIMQYLAWLGGKLDASTIEKDVNIEQKVLESNPLLEAFGNAKTVRNDNSSRFGKFTEIQFDSKGRISGAAIRTYLLERSRVVNITDPERNYHIFYQICDGATEEERLKWKLLPSTEFAYLSSSSCHVLNGIDNSQEYMNTRHAMDVVGIPKDTQESVFQAIVAVLHLGNIVFEAIDEDKAIVSASKGEESLKVAAYLLGVPVDGLRKILTTRTRHTVDGPIVSLINLESAIDTRDSLAKTLYSRTFDWLVDCINLSIGQDTDACSVIGVLDIYGFEEFARNDFEQLCINFANEKLQQHFNQHVFKMEQAEYEKEGIEWSYIEFVDNQDVLDVIEGTGAKQGRKLGILDLLDETCRFPRFTYKDFAQKLEASDFVKNSPRYSKARLSQTEFIIDHYAGKVQYDTRNYLEKNKDFVVLEHQELLGKSSQDFVKTLFPTNSSAEVENVTSSFKFSSVSSRFKKQLAELMNTLQKMEPHYIRCIKPNKNCVPMEFDNSSVLQQLRCGGVLEAVRISCAGYPSKRTYEEFYDHFWMMALDAGSECDSEKSLAKFIIGKHLSQQDTQFGLTRIFLRAGRMAELEKKRMETQNVAATMIQSHVKSWLARLHYMRVQKAVLSIQSYARSWIAIARLNELRNQSAALKIQCAYRAHKARKMYLDAVRAVVKIQQAYRACVKQRNLLAEKKKLSAIKIQSKWRSYIYQKEYLRILHAIVLAQSIWRAKLARRELSKRKIASRESENLLKDKRALELKVIDLEKVLEKIKNQRDSLRKQLRDEKAHHAKLQAEGKKRLEEVEAKSQSKINVEKTNVARILVEKNELIETISTMRQEHARKDKSTLQEKSSLHDLVADYKQKVEGLEKELVSTKEVYSRKFGNLQLELNRVIAERDRAREEVQISEGMKLANNGHVGTDGYVSVPATVSEYKNLLSDSPSLQRESGRQALSPGQNISDIDRKQREILAKQQQLIREQRIAEQEKLIMSLKQNLGFDGERPIAAIIVFRSCLKWKAMQQEKNTLFDRIMETIGQQVEGAQENNIFLGYWLTNTVALYYLMQKYTKPAGESGITARLRMSGQQGAKGLIASAASFFSRSPIRNSGDPSIHGGTAGLSVQLEAKYPALLFKQKSSALVQTIFPMLRDNIKREISSSLGACINATKSSHLNRSSGRRGPRKTNENSDTHDNGSAITAPWKEIMQSFDKLLNVLQENHVPPLLASRLMEQLFNFVNVQLFNQLLLKRECCSFSNGELVKMGLAEVEQWTVGAGKSWVGNSWEQLQHLRQAVTFLVIHQKSKKTLDEIMKDLCPSLSVQQIYRISTMYWDDRFDTESVSHEVLSEMKRQMAGDGAQAQSHSFLLDDDSAVPFNLEDIGSIYDGVDLLDGISVPNAILSVETKGFSFLESREKLPSTIT